MRGETNQRNQVILVGMIMYEMLIVVLLLLLMMMMIMNNL